MADIRERVVQGGRCHSQQLSTPITYYPRHQQRRFQSTHFGLGGPTGKGYCQLTATGLRVRWCEYRDAIR